ncbi:MAG TPA: hypothetical protein VGI55_11290 [Solirubrobacteraceae bacterium]
MLAVLLGVANARDPSFNWLWDGLGPLPTKHGSARPLTGFEHKLGPDALGEQPTQTSIDFYVDDPAALLCFECY